MFSGEKIVVFDCEIKKEIKTQEDWRDFKTMGVSCLVLYDYETSRFRTFDDRNIQEGLKILSDAEILVGYNIMDFDIPLLSNTYSEIPEGLSLHNQTLDKELNYAPFVFDILQEIWKKVERHSGGCKLDDIAYETLGLKKSGNGAHAPVLFKEQRYAELFDYCIQDVKIEKELFEYVCLYQLSTHQTKRSID